MTSEASNALRHCAFFEEFQPRHMDKLMTLGSEVHFAKDQIIFSEDDESGLFYVLLSGRVALESNLSGWELPVQTLYPGEELGWSAVINCKRRFRARAVEPVEAMAFEVSRLREACIANPYFGCAFMERLFRVVAERLQGTRLQLADALAKLEPPNKA